MTGLTDQMRSDFHLMKDIAETTKCDPGQRLQTTRALLTDLQNPKYERAYEIMKNWQIKINHEPIPIQGSKLEAGSYIMGQQQNGNRL